MRPEDKAVILITMAIEPKRKDDSEAFAAALADLNAADRSFRFVTNVESRQTILQGISEAQLDNHVMALRSTYGIDVKIGAPQIAYRETIVRRVEKDYTFAKWSDGARQFARVTMIVEPYPDGTLFESKIVAGTWPEVFVPRVERGIDSVMRSGILAGFPIADVKVTLIEGESQGCSASDNFEIAARAAFREALRDGGSVLLEPIMAIEIKVPEDYVGSVTGDLLGRRGQVKSRSMQSDGVLIEANAPFANLFGYDNQLRSFTQGRGRYAMYFAFFQTVDIATPPEPRFPPAAVAMRVA